MAVHLPVLYHHTAIQTRLDCTVEAKKSWPKTVKCTRGCNSCCNRKLEITLAEAIEIVHYLKKTNQWAQVSTKISKLDMDLSLVDPTVYFSMSKPCVLLKDGECMAYAVRPISCASHYVHSDPKLCDALSGEEGIYEVSAIVMKIIDFKMKLKKIFETDSILTKSGWLPFALKAASAISEHKYESFEDFISIFKGEFK